MAAGKIKSYNNKWGYGYIRDDETGKDVFVYLGNFVTDSYKENDKVTFDIIEDSRGQRAVNVKKVVKE